MMACVSALEHLVLTVAKEVVIFAKEAMPFLRQFRPEMIVFQENVGEAGSFLARALINPAGRALATTTDGRGVLEVARVDDPSILGPAVRATHLACPLSVGRARPDRHECLVRAQEHSWSAWIVHHDPRDPGAAASLPRAPPAATEPPPPEARGVRRRAPTTPARAERH